MMSTRGGRIKTGENCTSAGHGGGGDNFEVLATVCPRLCCGGRNKRANRVFSPNQFMTRRHFSFFSLSRPVFSLSRTRTAQQKNRSKKACCRPTWFTVDPRWRRSLQATIALTIMDCWHGFVLRFTSAFVRVVNKATIVVIAGSLAVMLVTIERGVM